MPPIRTVSTTKAIKTERTHEENQERAYIAASRRSDRSLEARIESARRASEIHKKRTGRALRVTEQDVVNEEMYEEEDEDLPAQIRRLQSFAHLQTGSMEFNRRLQAYMSSQMGTRSALMEQGNYMQPYPNAPFFANQFGQPQPQPSMLPPHMLHYSNPQIRHTPYPMSPHNYGALAHHRSASSSAQDMSFAHSNPPSPAVPQLSEEHRRMSLPSPGMPMTPTVQAQTPIRPSMSRATSNVDAEGSPSHQAMSSGGLSQAPLVTTMGSELPASAEAVLETSPQNVNFAPFSTSLPPETQQLLVQPSSLYVNEQFNPFWALGNPALSSYSYKPNFSLHAQMTDAGQQSVMNPTLSLNPLDTHVDTTSSQNYATSATTDGVTSPFSGTFSNYNFSTDNLFADSMKASNLTRTSSTHDSGEVTPGGGGDWASFLESFEDVNAGNASA